jgi:hypothetical protein
MIEEAFHAARIGRGIGETVAGAASKLQAPVDAGFLHLLLEIGAPLGRDDRSNLGTCANAGRVGGRLSSMTSTPSA